VAPHQNTDRRLIVCGEKFTLAARLACQSTVKQRRLRVRRADETGEALVEGVACCLTPESREHFYAMAEDRERGLSFPQLRDIAVWIADVVGDESLGSRMEKAAARVDARHRRVVAAERDRVQGLIDCAFVPRRRADKRRPSRPIAPGRRMRFVLYAENAAEPTLSHAPSDSCSKS
jgi:hypothetical protein